jgi:hypothetical protein
MNIDKKTSEQLRELIRVKKMTARDLNNQLECLDMELEARKIRKHPRDQRGRLLNFAVDCADAILRAAKFMGGVLLMFMEFMGGVLHTFMWHMFIIYMYCAAIQLMQIAVQAYTVQQIKNTPWYL